MNPQPISLNRGAAAIVENLVADAKRLRVDVSHGERGVRVVDAGIQCVGSVEAGLRIAEICMGGLGRVRLASSPQEGWPTWLEVSSSQPVLACLGAQYAGWSLAASKEETGGRKFFALGSGPARALAAKEDLYKELAALGHEEHCDSGVLVLEVDRPVPAVIVDKVLRDCRLSPQRLTFVLTPTQSFAGTTQVVARVLEVALHRAHELGFALGDIVEGAASAPLPAPGADAITAMGRTNDAILYGGRVHLTVRGDADKARALALAMPSQNSRDYGRSFADLFAAAGYDFYKLDGALFAPAEVWITHQGSGRTWHAGRQNMPLLRELWLAEAAS
jgi:methenyltetrahydromethanopterin cyclohydrolase